MNEKPPIIEPVSPCVRNCCLDEDDICMGCGRSLAEIVGWTKADNAGKTRTLELAEARRAARRSRFGR